MWRDEARQHRLQQGWQQRGRGGQQSFLLFPSSPLPPHPPKSPSFTLPWLSKKVLAGCRRGQGVCVSGVCVCVIGCRSLITRQERQR